MRKGDQKKGARGTERGVLVQSVLSLGVKRHGRQARLAKH